MKQNAWNSCGKGLVLLIGPSLIITGVVLMLTARDQTSAALASTTDFVFLGPVCQVEQMDWFPIIEETKLITYCRDGYR
jgi:hypothetical protein